MHLTFLVAVFLVVSPGGSSLPVSASSIFDNLLASPTSYGFDNWGRSLNSEVLNLRDKAVNESLNNCQCACSLLPLLASSYITSPTSPGYRPLAYWSVQQAEVVPACRIDVISAEDIATTIKVSKLTQCPFAVKSGGHTAFAGGSSIQNGILINLRDMNLVSMSEDRSVTQIGPGNTWYEVYRTLDPLGVSVVGGREAGVGVGGLLLGGGVSYFSGRFGWACDNVVNYQVVLANGSIVNASPISAPDLYWALRGGSGTNFGIVSRFDLATFDQGLLWGGSRYYSMIENASLADAFSKFVSDASSDDFAHLYIAFGYTAELGGFAGFSGMAYGRPISNASIFTGMNNIPLLIDATGISNMTGLAVALNQTSFTRETFKTVTFRNNPTLIKMVIKIFTEEVTTVLNITGIAPFFAFQPISLNIIAQMQKNGGNVLGLSEADGPLIIMNLNWGWSNAVDDDKVSAAIDRFISRSVRLAKFMGLDKRFIYMNYATLDQDVFGGYGVTNMERLRDIQSKYDPERVFKRLQPGYFKL